MSFDIEIKDLLEEKYLQFNRQEFIEDDPISIPHAYSKKQDIEITAFFASILAWGQRKTIINKCEELFRKMDYAPYDFILNHEDSDLKCFLDFKHRTFNAVDALYFIRYFKDFYSKNESLEIAFSSNLSPKESTVESALTHFKDSFFSLSNAPLRSQKHIASPARKSACKRLNMFLRWMVRKDSRGVDFGIWDNIKSSQLVCPLDVHVDRVSRNLGLLKRKQTDWLAAVELTNELKKMDSEDPVKYDFSLFGLGLEMKNT